MDIAARKELEAIKQAILKTVKANEIYLFGSYANGTSAASLPYGNRAKRKRYAAGHK